MTENLSFQRILLHCVESEEEDDRLPIMLDCRINSTSRKVDGKWIIFGLWGSYDEDEQSIYPFVLESTGQLDFGSYGDGEDRFGQTNLRDFDLSANPLVDFEDWDGNKYKYRIKSRSVLGLKVIN